jgi:hypothetical protein
MDVAAYPFAEYPLGNVNLLSALQGLLLFLCRHPRNLRRYRVW